MFFQICILLAAASNAARIKAIAPEDATPPKVSLAPFTVQLTINNKREIMDKYATSWFGGILNYAIKDEAFTGKVADQLTTKLPPILSEKAGIDCVLVQLPVIPGQELTARMQMEILGYDIASLLAKAKGQAFADALMSLSDIMTRLGMPDKFAEIEGKVGVKVRGALMTKIPEILTAKMKEEQGIEVTVTVSPPPPPQEAPPTRQPEPAWDMAFRVSDVDREVLAEQTKGLKGVVVRKMPQHMLIQKVQDMLKGKISDAIVEKLGSGLQLEVEIQNDAEAGSASKTDSFWMILHVKQRSLQDILKTTKGDEFASAFEDLLEALDVLADGVGTMDIVRANILTGIDEKILDGLATNIQEKLSSALQAKVQQVSAESCEQLQAQAASGRCCATAQKQYFWIKSGLDRGAGPLGLGYGRSGHCPKVIPGRACAFQGIATSEVVST
eukprot:CAMPEP_0169358780 /NCGR_PEP_ID=MMETSP1017-20121227/28871_1 /TAXON_ID=342587 /ORGANISM="Karlodinium micrum, Strain CCMP2283" /LENGTH=442 /DNA_ID=CAMNT_0009455883 /DNA_START=64 /DNA_END=1388 /DNA_ORIENTATION=+